LIIISIEMLQMGMTVAEFRKNAHTTIDLICDYFTNVDKYPVVSQVKPNEVAQKLPKMAPLRKCLSVLVTTALLLTVAVANIQMENHTRPF
jgi:hypothetical protein